MRAIKKINWVVLLLMFNYIISAHQKWLWASDFGGVHSYLHSSGIAVDKNGNSFVTGYIEGKVYFSNNYIVSTSFSSSQGAEPFLAKYDVNGNILWVKLINKLTDVSYGRGRGVAVNANGDVYITGDIVGKFDFGGTNLYTASTGSDGFIAKYTKDGSLIWVKQLGKIVPVGTAQNEVSSQTITIDSEDNCYAAGFFTNKANFGSSILITQAGTSNTFIIKCAPNGNTIWTKKSSGDYFEITTSIAVDNLGNCFITGEFESNVCQIGTYTLTSNNGNEANLFVAAMYSKNGDFRWVKQAKSINYSTARGNGIACDYKGGCFVTGYAGGQVVFDSFTILTPDESLADIFIANYDYNGNLQWIKQEGGANSEDASCISYDVDGDALYIAGNFMWWDSPTVFNNSVVITSVQTGGFLAKYNSSGDFGYVTAVNTITPFGISAGPKTINGYSTVHLTGDGSVSTITNPVLFEDYINGNTGVYLKGYSTEPNQQNSFVSKYITNIKSGAREINVNNNFNQDLVENNFNIYPNPSDGNFSITIQSNTDAFIAIEICNLLGEQIYSKELEVVEDNNQMNIKLNSLSNGVYLIKINTNEKTYLKKITINK